MEIVWFGCGAAAGFLTALLLPGIGRGRRCIRRGTRCGRCGAPGRLLGMPGRRRKKGPPAQDELTQSFLRLLTDGDSPGEE